MSNLTLKEALDRALSVTKQYIDNINIFSGSYNDLTNKPIIPTVTNDLTNELKSKYDIAYNHSQADHAPSNAQKNSDITKAEIEAKLTGTITSHEHNYTTPTDVDNAINSKFIVLTKAEYDALTSMDSGVIYFIIQ